MAKSVDEMSEAELDALLAKQSKPKSVDEMSEAELDALLSAAPTSKAIPMLNAEGRKDAQGRLVQTPVVDEESFAKQKAYFGTNQYKVPETSTLEQGAAAVMDLGATMNPFTDEIAAGVRSLMPGKSYDQELANVRESQQILRDRNPNAALVGTGAGIAGSVVLGGANIGRQAALNAAQMAGASEGDLGDRAIMGAAGAVLPYAVKGAGTAISKVGSKATQSLKGLGAKSVDSLKSGLKRLGFDADEIREAGKQALKADAPSGNPLVQLKTLVDEGIIKGKQTTVEIAERFSDVLETNAAKVNELVENPVVGNTILPTSKSILQLKLNPKQIALRGGPDAYRQEAVKILQKNAPGLIDSTGNIRELTLKEAQYLKQGLQALRGDWSKRIDIDDVSKEVITSAENHLRDVIEEYSPEIAKLNRVSSAILGLKDNVIKLENKGIDVSQGRLAQSLNKTLSSPFTTGAAGAGLGAILAPTVGADPRQGALAGASLGAGIRAASYPKALQDSLSGVNPVPSTLPRNAQAIGQFLNQNAAQVSAPIAALISKFNSMPENKKQELMPVVMQTLESEGIASFEPPLSGYASEIDGKLTDPNDIIEAGKALWQRSDLTPMQKAKMLQSLNKEGKVPMQIYNDGDLIIDTGNKNENLIKVAPQGSYEIRETAAPLPVEEAMQRVIKPKRRY